MSQFVGIDLARENVPDATTLVKLRQLLEEYRLGAAILAKANVPSPMRRMQLCATELVV